MGVVSCGTTMLDQGVFQNIGAVTWDTTAKTAGFTAVSGNGYFVNTTSGAITVTLPSSPAAGAIVGIKDYANTADTNAITIGRNGSNIQGVANDYLINTEGRSVLLVYVDATKGWLVTSASQASDIVNPAFTVATGGTITTSGDYKIHTFTGPGTFTVTQIGNAPTVPAGGPSNVDYLVVAGGGGGRDCEGYGGGAGGAGGYRTSYPSPAGTLPVSVTGYPITVGGGGSPVCISSPSGSPGNGSNSVFSTITSTGGGGGGRATGPGWTSYPAATGGSGGGGAGGTGNTPPVSPPQGFPGGNGCAGNAHQYQGGGDGGGGATAAGQGGAPTADADGGAGASNSITGSPVTYAGGGGGSAYGRYDSGCGGAGGGGKGGRGPAPSYGHPTGVQAIPGTINTGGGGGGGAYGSPANPSTWCGGTGGSGIVIIRYKFQ